MIGNAEYFAADQDLADAYAAGELTRADYIAARAALADTWSVPSTLAAQVVDFTAEQRTVLDQIGLLNLTGTVASVGDLPGGAANGDTYVVSNNGHAYIRLTGVWKDLGPYGGRNGVAIFAVTGAPASDLGIAGDLALDLATGDFYGPKSASSWGAPVLATGLQAKVVAAAASAAAAAASKTAVDTKVADYFNQIVFEPSPPETGYLYRLRGADWTVFLGVTTAGKVYFAPEDGVIGQAALAPAMARAFDNLAYEACPPESGFLRRLRTANFDLVAGLTLDGKVLIQPVDGSIGQAALPPAMGKAFNNVVFEDCPPESGYLRRLRTADFDLILGLRTDGQLEGRFYIANLTAQIDNTRWEAGPVDGPHLYRLKAADGSDLIAVRRADGVVEGRFAITATDLEPATGRIMAPNALETAETPIFDTQRMTRSKMCQRTATSGAAFVGLPRVLTSLATGINTSGTSLEFRRRAPLQIVGARDRGIFTPTYDTIALAGGYPLNALSMVTLTSTLPPSPTLGMYAQYLSDTPRTSGLNGDTANRYDLVVWTSVGGTPQWRVQPAPATYASHLEGDFFTAGAAFTFMGMTFAAGDPILWQGRSGSGGPQAYTRGRPEAGEYVFKGGFTPASGLPASPNSGEVWIASAAGTASGLTFAEGDWLVRYGTTWGPLAGETRQTVANGGFVALPCRRDTSEWEVRRADKSDTRVAIVLDVARLAAPPRTIDNVFMPGDSIIGSAAGREHLFGKRKVVVRSNGGATTRDIIGDLKDLIQNRGDPYRGWVHAFMFGNNDGADIDVIMEALPRAIDMIGVTNPRWLYIANLCDIVASWDGTRIACTGAAGYRDKTGVMWKAYAEPAAAYPGHVADMTAWLLSQASASIPHLWFPGMSEKAVADTYSILPLSHHLITPTPVWTPADLVSQGYRSAAGLPTGGANGDYFIRNGGGTVGNIIARWAGVWTEHGYDAIHPYTDSGRTTFTQGVVRFLNERNF